LSARQVVVSAAQGCRSRAIREVSVVQPWLRRVIRPVAVVYALVSPRLKAEARTKT